MIAVLKKEFEQKLDFLGVMGSKFFLFPFVGRSRLSINCYRFICFLIMFTAMQLVITPCVDGVNDWMDIINIAPNIGACLISLIKYCKMHANKEVYDEIFYHFRNDFWELYPNYLPQYQKILIKYRKVLNFIAKFFIRLTVVLIITVDSLPYVVMTYESEFLGKDFKYLYPFDAWYPFNKVKWYSVAYLWEGSMTAIVVCVYALSNVIHLSYIALICMELDLLGKLLDELISNDDVYNIIQRRRLEETHKNIKKHLKYIAKNHANLAR